jgi:hypothetical protein
MAEEEAKQFEQHCDACAKCAAILVREMAIMGLMRAAGRGSSPKKT